MITTPGTSAINVQRSLKCWVMYALLIAAIASTAQQKQDLAI